MIRRSTSGWYAQQDDPVTRNPIGWGTCDYPIVSVFKTMNHVHGPNFSDLPEMEEMTGG